MTPPVLSLSVIICTLNNYKGLEQCVASICRQTLKPAEIIVVHGDKGGSVIEQLTPLLVNTSISLNYVRSIRSLVIQRNDGIDHAKGDVVVFLDDDVILKPEYFERLMDVYRENWNYNVGGVQGSIIIEDSKIKYWNLLQTISRIFLLQSATGKGTLLASANPAFLGDSRTVEKVEIFSGCMMSFRRDVLQKHRFDENFREFWAYDDVELSYRISRQYDLYQTPLARLHHIGSSFNYEGYRKIDKMSVVNRFYVFKKYFAHSKWNWCLFAWSNFGEVLVKLMLCAKHRNLEPIAGFIEGWRLVQKKQIPYL